MSSAKAGLVCCDHCRVSRAPGKAPNALRMLTKSGGGEGERRGEKGREEKERGRGRKRRKEEWMEGGMEGRNGPWEDGS